MNSMDRIYADANAIANAERGLTREQSAAALRARLEKLNRQVDSFLEKLDRGETRLRGEN